MEKLLIIIFAKIKLVLYVTKECIYYDQAISCNNEKSVKLQIGYAKEFL